LHFSKNKIATTKNKQLLNFYIQKYADCLGNEAYNQTAKGNYGDTVLNLYEESLRNYERIPDLDNIARTNNNIGLYFYTKSNYSIALNYYQKALAMSKKIQNSEGTASSLNNIASVYYNCNNFDLALKYYKECMTMNAAAGNSNSMPYLYNNIGSIYSEKKQFDSAIHYLQKSIDLSQIPDEQENLTTAFNNMSAIYTDKKEFNKALDYLNKSIAISLKHQFKANEAISYLKVAKIWQQLNELNKAISFAQKSLAIGKQIKSLDITNRASQQLIGLYKTNHNFKEALEMTDLYATTNDSIHSKDTEKALIQTQIKYEYDKKAIADSLQTIKDKAVLTVQIEKEKNQKIFLYSLLILIVAFVAFVLNRFRKTNKQKQLIENANQNLARQHLLNQKIFSVISHDFRGPILSLTLLLESFKTKSNDVLLNSYVLNVTNEVTNANEILNNLLNWARTELNIKDVDAYSSNVLSIFNATIVEFNQKLADKTLLINMMIATNATIALPPDIVRIALRNLISNAIKFSYANTAITVSFDQETAALSVKDMGKGMTVATQHYLFKKEVNTQLGTNNEEGFGMGLYILSELLHKYNYTIAVESELNKGSCFTIKRI
jgi:two-component system, sensor histidine kinase and response regulator